MGLQLNPLASGAFPSWGHGDSPAQRGPVPGTIAAQPGRVGMWPHNPRAMDVMASEASRGDIVYTSDVRGLEQRLRVFPNVVVLRV